MKLRIAKKVARRPRAYSGQQRYTAAHRLYRRATLVKDGPAAHRALLLKPVKSFERDGQLDLRLELFTIMEEAHLPITFARGPVVVPKPNGAPYFRRDGQVMNFNALPYPGFDVGRQYSAKKYRLRNPGNQGLMPERSTLADYSKR